MHLSISKLQVMVTAFAAILAPINAVQASTIRYENLIDLEKTNFKKQITLPKFNSNLGDLESVLFELSGEVQGSIELENRDAQAAVITGNLAAEISLKKPDNSLLLVSLPTASVTQKLDAYDGSLDFGGTSGVTLTKISNTKKESAFFTVKDDFTPFIGDGSFKLFVEAIGNSKATGAGNLLAGFETYAGATVAVSYTYVKKDEPIRKKVPESQVPVSVFVGLAATMVLTKSKFRLV
ncbi:choice-of-anchor E domain-containing protein [Rivularia sp. UHCC 0363]|uniref:choice-of-anchor E domain-containing protein n=1 Tax=Rivularia sp. UHCC 0363 TaxID=3110244 RepID=UPI002B1F807C|nr:choice-of-anchor E domain-containing protein [Rivularia sp. UHCC 0363]MEA5598473.1 choice-of-anchor E domain-containing protein [Rivularia sp. UHCC 0363]